MHELWPGFTVYHDGSKCNFQVVVIRKRLLSLAISNKLRRQKQTAVQITTYA